MRNIARVILLVVPVIFAYSCRSARVTTGTAVPAGSLPSYAVNYLNSYRDLAIKEMHRTGIPASITLAQGMLESDYGRSTLARKGNNHFGIKCHSDWKGEKVYHDDNRKGECFRSYRSAEDSYRDHSDFLVNGSRYKDLFKLSSTDYKGWAHGLKKAGYATDPNYPSLLIRKIDEYGLHVYDTGYRKSSAKSIVKADPAIPEEKSTQEVVVPEKVEIKAQAEAEIAKPVTGDNISGKVITYGTSRIEEVNGVQYVIVREGDTFESLAEEFQLLSWEVSRYNDLPPNASLQPGQIIYLQPKRNKADTRNPVHVVMQGETMYYVSQKYAVRLAALYKMNAMEDGTECVAGQTIKLR